MAIGDDRLFTRNEIVAWRYDFLVNGNPAASLDSYWTKEVAERLRAAVLMKLPITVNEFRQDLKIVSPYSPDFIAQNFGGNLYEHPDPVIGAKYLYQVIAADPE